MKKLTVQQWLSWPPASCEGYELPFPSTGDITIGSVTYIEKLDTFKISDARVLSYSIAADRILSGRGLLDFILQLHHHEWVTADHIKDFLDCVTCWVYREHGKFPQAFFDVIGGMNAGLDSP
jgi:hypothetical protein